MGRDKVELFAAIREDHRQGLGVRALARKYGVHRRMMREALASPVPPLRKTPARQAPVRDAVAGLIDAMLAEDLGAPRKLRLADEHGVAVSYSCVCQYAGLRRAEQRAAAGSVAGFVPQAKEPGAEAEVDFGPVSIVAADDQVACHLFACRLSYSGKGVHRGYASCAQEAFFEGHVTAFEVAGGVPWRHIRYDNLSPAVVKVMTGRSRTETDRWLSFRLWYGFEAFYCIPGREGAHEKGGVESEIGRFRRGFLVPVPQAGSLAELNARLAGADIADDRRHIEYRTASVADDFAAEQRFLGSLPADGFDTGTVLWPRADKFARISVGKCLYSVPARMIGARALIGLLLHRRLPAASVTAGITAALEAGTCSPDVDDWETRRKARTSSAPAPAPTGCGSPPPAGEAPRHRREGTIRHGINPPPRQRSPGRRR
jgi:transposase